MHIRKVAVNWKTHCIWHRKGYRIICNKIFFSKGMLHLLEGSSIVFQGIVCWKNIVLLSKENCKWMKHVSLRAGDTSLLHLILHFRTGTHYYVKLMLHLWKMVPLQGKAVLLLGTPCIFWTKTWYFATDRGRVPATILMILRCKCVLLFLNSVYLHFDPLPYDSDVSI